MGRMREYFGKRESQLCQFPGKANVLTVWDNHRKILVIYKWRFEIKGFNYLDQFFGGSAGV
jgi:hypothetical protein